MNIEQHDNDETQSVREYLIYGAKLSRRAFLGGSGALIASLALDPKLAFAAANSSQPTSLDAAKPAFVKLAPALEGNPFRAGNLHRLHCPHQLADGPRHLTGRVSGDLPIPLDMRLE